MDPSKIENHLQTLIGDVMKPRVIADGHCEKCNQDFVYYEAPCIGGPKKGELIRFKKGCICEEVALAKETTEAYSRLQEKKRLEEFKKLSIIPPKLTTATFKSYKPKNESQLIALQQAIKYAKEFDVKNPNPSNFALVGDNGTGKSHLALSITKEVMARGSNAVFISVPRLLAKLRDSYGTDTAYKEIQYLELLESVDILVLDDIGMCKATDWATEKLFMICDMRQGKHTIYTTSKNSGEILDLYGKDNFSRMALNKDNSFKILGEDMRRK